MRIGPVKGMKVSCHWRKQLKLETYLEPQLMMHGPEELPYFHVLDKAMQCKNSIGCKIKGKVTVNKVPQKHGSACECCSITADQIDQTCMT